MVWSIGIKRATPCEIELEVAEQTRSGRPQFATFVEEAKEVRLSVEVSKIDDFAAWLEELAGAFREGKRELEEQQAKKKKAEGGRVPGDT